MLCSVEERVEERVLPACSVKAMDGMVVQTDTDNIASARKCALDLLLSEHVGDCEAPCRRACPAFMNIPRMIRGIAAGNSDAALEIVREHIPLASVLGRICPAPCEKVCRRKELDGPVAICLLKRHVGDGAGRTPASSGRTKPPSGKTVAIVGAGPAGLTAAYYLCRAGHACVVFDDHEEAGGMLRYGVGQDVLPRDVLDRDIAGVIGMGVDLRPGTRVGIDIAAADLGREFDAVVLAVGRMDVDHPVDFGVRTSSRGIVVQKKTFMTSSNGFFACGGATGPSQMAVRAVGQGRGAAVAVDQSLRGEAITGWVRRFDSRMGRLREGEIDELAREVSREPRVSPADPCVGFSAGEAVKEAGRCLHCDCRDATGCQLRKYADAYGAEQRRFGGGDRKPFQRFTQHASVVFEPGKCIKCGICVRITEEAAEPLGLTFIGRGFNVRVGVPFDAPMSEALQKVAADCVTACPTGALAFKSE
jgi:ferredoxin